jgi:hypothetical protein
MKFLDVFQSPDKSVLDPKLAFTRWLKLGAWFEEHGYDIDVSHKLSDVRTFWESLPEATRNKVRMPPAQDCAFHKPEESDVIVFTASRPGEGPVATIGMRRVWLDRSLAEMMTDLTFWYGDQAATMADHGRVCRVSAPAAYELESSHLGWFGGGINVSKDSKVYKALARAALFYVATHWQIKAVAAIVEGSTFRLHGFDWYGFTRCELGVWRDQNEFLLASMSRRELVAAAAMPGFCEAETPLKGFLRDQARHFVPPALRDHRVPALTSDYAFEAAEPGMTV